MDLIDTHLHVIDTARLNYPWLESFEPLRRDYPVSQWETEARRSGITAALHMEVDVAEADIEAETAMAEGMMAQARSLVIGAISSCRPETNAFPAFLDLARARKSIKGFRRVLHVVPDAVSKTALFRENLRRLSGTGLPFDICMLARQLPLAAELIDSAPDVQFVLDHCGVPDVKGKAFEPWGTFIADIAKRPNVAMKISGVSAYADAASWSVDDLRPFVEHCITVFGWDRVVWGSDWPVVTLGSSMSTWVAATHALVSGASNDEKAKLFSVNAKRIWNI